MAIKCTILFLTAVLIVQGASIEESGSITRTAEPTTGTTTEQIETTVSTATITPESTNEFSTTTDLLTSVSSTGTREPFASTTTGRPSTTTGQHTVSSAGTPEALVGTTTVSLTSVGSTAWTSRTTVGTSTDQPTGTSERTTETVTSTTNDQSTSFSTAATSESSTEPGSTASTPQNQTKWRSSSISTVTPITATSTTENPIDEATQLYNEIKNATENGLIQTHNFVEQIFWSSITFTSSGIKNIFKISFEFFEQLDKLNRKYIKFGVDISSCIELVQPEFSELPLILTNQLTECIKPGIDVVSNDLFTTVRNVTTLWNVVLDLGIELDNCGTNSSCVIDLMSRMTVEFIEIPTTINTDLLRIQQYLDKTTVFAATCAESKFSAATTNGTRAIKTVTDCAREIF